MHWTFLDNQFTINIFKSKKLLTDIREADEPVRCYCNGGFQDTLESGTLTGVGEIHYNITSLTNILSTAQLGSKYRITIDTWVEDSFTVHDFRGHELILNYFYRYNRLLCVLTWCLWTNWSSLQHILDELDSPLSISSSHKDFPNSAKPSERC